MHMGAEKTMPVKLPVCGTSRGFSTRLFCTDSCNEKMRLARRRGGGRREKIGFLCTIAVALHNGTTVPDKKGEDRFFRAIAQNRAEQKTSKAA